MSAGLSASVRYIDPSTPSGLTQIGLLTFNNQATGTSSQIAEINQQIAQINTAAAETATEIAAINVTTATQGDQITALNGDVTTIDGNVAAVAATANAAAKIAGDLGGTAAAPKVNSTSLLAPLPVLQGGTGNPLGQSPRSGATAARPGGCPLGFLYFDTTLNKPVWYTGAGATGWVDATGTAA